MRTTEIAASFLSYFERLGYDISADHPLDCQDDDTLIFTNASITPFKPALLGGEVIPDTVQVQSCFRAKVKDGWLLSFRMLGVVAMEERLEQVTRHFLSYLTDEIRPSISPDQIHAVIHPEDRDIEAVWTRVAGDERVHHYSLSTELYTTRWQYGHGDRLTGRGMTVVWENLGAPSCSETCSVLCRCSRFLPLANIIIVTSAGAHPSTSYVEVGCGVEGLAGLEHGGDLLMIEEYAEVIRRVVLAGYSEASAKRAAILVAGIMALLSAGLRPGNKRGPYVMRSVIRQLADLALERVGLDSLRQGVAELLRAGDIVEEGAEEVLREIDVYASSISKGVRSARKLIRGRRATSQPLPRLLRETYGLPTAVIDSLLGSISHDSLQHGEPSNRERDTGSG